MKSETRGLSEIAELTTGFTPRAAFNKVLLQRHISHGWQKKPDGAIWAMSEAIVAECPMFFSESERLLLASCGSASSTSNGLINVSDFGFVVPDESSPIVQFNEVAQYDVDKRAFVARVSTGVYSMAPYLDVASRDAGDALSSTDSRKLLAAWQAQFGPDVSVTPERGSGRWCWYSSGRSEDLGDSLS